MPVLFDLYASLADDRTPFIALTVQKCAELGRGAAYRIAEGIATLGDDVRCPGHLRNGAAHADDDCL